MVQINTKCEIDHKDSDVYCVLSVYLFCDVTTIEVAMIQTFYG